jgi:6-phosphogluconolactonase
MVGRNAGMGIKQRVYVETYTLPIVFGTGQILKGKGKGIYVYEFNADAMPLDLISVARGVDNPSYLAINDEKQIQ